MAETVYSYIHFWGYRIIERFRQHRVSGGLMRFMKSRFIFLEEWLSSRRLRIGYLLCVFPINISACLSGLQHHTAELFASWINRHRSALFFLRLPVLTHPSLLANRFMPCHALEQSNAFNSLCGLRFSLQFGLSLSACCACNISERGSLIRTHDKIEDFSMVQLFLNRGASSEYFFTILKF